MEFNRRMPVIRNLTVGKVTQISTCCCNLRQTICMRSTHLLLSLLLLTNVIFAQSRKTVKDASYFPPMGQWEEKSATSLGLNQAAIDSTIAFSIAHESSNPRSMEVNHYQTFGREPFGEAIGPLADRGTQTGIIIYKGYIVAKWGEPSRCDMTHSVTKSFLSSIVGVAVDSGLIRSVFDTVAPYVPPIEVYNPGYVQRPADQYGTEQPLRPFSSAHNREIRWDDLLRQTSDWEGILWGKPEWADRPDKDPSTWTTRPRVKPGTVFEYNDVRVNVLALAAASVWRKPLPQVLKSYIMDPIGASNTWRWAGYRNAWIVLDGAPSTKRKWWRSLGRRHVYQCLRHGAIWAAHAASWRMEWEAVAE